MRDRLIEMINEAKKQECLDAVFGDIDSLIDSPRGAEAIADHLLANGVIVPPCKVGENLYFNKAETDETCPAKVIGICIDYYTPSMPLWITIEYESKLIGRQEEKMTSGVFELLCHYSREEAEVKLKGEQ